ncbi:MAG: type I-C CRISPR-associated protein Cas5c [Bryobacteraceae bacterium]
MNTPKRGVAAKVFGDYACFSRPEFKVERVSYAVPTPSAARGILEAIFWKPEFRYEIREIHILKFGTQVSILRNEIADRQSRKPITVEHARQQRTSLILKDVAYVIRAELVLRSVEAEPGKYLDQFNRHLEKGQCHHTPCLGTREFAAAFEPAGDDDCGERQNPGLTLNLGNMLFEIAYVEGGECEGKFWKGWGEARQEVDGHAVPLFFNASIQQGVLSVPREEYKRLYAMEAGNA